MAQRTLLVCLLPTLFSLIAVRAFAIDAYSVHLQSSVPLIPPCVHDFAVVGNAVDTKSIASLPKPIRRAEAVVLYSKVVDVERLKKAVQLIDLTDPNSKIPNLKDGLYLYAIDRDGKRLAIVPRELDPGEHAMAADDAQFLGSHEGIRIYLADLFGHAVEFAAAGEVVVKNGRTFAFSNGAGTYKGDTENLNYALQIFKSRGLKTDSRTEIRDHATLKYQDPHFGTAHQARIAIEASRNPEFVKLLEYARRVMTKMDHVFPHPREAVTLASKSFVPKDFSEATGGLLIYGQWQKATENEAFVIANEIKKNSIAGADGMEKVRRGLELLEQLADNAPAAATSPAAK